MRIVGGKYRHRIIIYPDDATHTRPTKDRVREAIFSAIGDISNARVLDLYAGSGAMGIEALSRGASHCTFVDISPIAIKTIKENLNNLKIDNNEFEVIKNKDINAIESFTNKFDLIILDPPYEEGQYELIVNLLKEKDLLSEHAIIVMEANRSIKLENIDYIKNKEYHYGEINVFIYWR
jgi:16S rRNA (guanine(966)-N(2))-methyltransferase RsmD